jgi:hypothetical protein
VSDIFFSPFERLLRWMANFVGAEMKFIVAAIYTNYRTSIVDDEGIEQEDAYTARPRGCRLILKFEPIKD